MFYYSCVTHVYDMHMKHVHYLCMLHNKERVYSDWILSTAWCTHTFSMIVCKFTMHITFIGNTLCNNSVQNTQSATNKLNLILIFIFTACMYIHLKRVLCWFQETILSVRWGQSTNLLYTFTCNNEITTMVIYVVKFRQRFRVYNVPS